MIYQALYRAYRPQSFQEISGQHHVKQTLQNALLHNKTTHAYLFTGPRGTGKTSVAKIFAKALNCENGPAKEPCNECGSCSSITDGSNTDVVEFDAASNSRVHEMRDIIKEVYIAPANSRLKVYIIDEVHMLSKSAFNALLKTLEEPPEHVVFILATTESHQLPLTIISRCQRFDFKPLTPPLIVERLETVLKDVAVEAEPSALRIIAQVASGGMRDALSILDQVVSFSGNRFTAEDVLLVTGAIGEDVFYQLSIALQEKDAGSSLSLLNELIAEGKDVLRLAEDLITFFRDLLLLRSAPELEDLLQIITPNEKFQTLAQSFEQEVLYAYIDILAEKQQEMRFSNNAKIYVESALLKMTRIHSKPETGQANVELENKVMQLERMLADLQQQIQAGIQMKPNAAMNTAQQSRRNHSKGSQKVHVPTGKINDVLGQATKEDIQLIRENWAGMLQMLQKSHAALLNEAEPVAASSSSFVLKFKYDIHCSMALANDSLQAGLTEALAARTGKKYDVIYVPEQAWLKVRSDFIQNHQLKKSDDEDEAQQQVENSTHEDLLQEIEEELDDPIVTKAEKLFGEDLIEVHDD